MIYLWLDDVRLPPKGWTWVKTVAKAKQQLLTGQVIAASLDHDLGELEDGTDLVEWMAEQNVWPSRKPIVHSANPVGAARMRQIIDRYWNPW